MYEESKPIEEEMDRYPDETTRRFDQQFAESPAEHINQRNKRKLDALILDVEQAIASLDGRWANLARVQLGEALERARKP